ncbi:MAG: NUDIX hydrolase [Saprospiraceae bacterium]|nr:NUDIX hydrolase [Saprospiraceae bacterium]
MEYSDWKTLDKAIVYENPWIRVEHRNVINPSGNRGIYGTVHYKNIAIAILPIDDEGFTYIVGQYRYVLQSYSWEIPEGGCPEGEATLEAAKRELKEETGLEATKWTPILEMDLSNSVSDEVSLSYLAQGISNGNAAPEETENLQVKKIHFDELVRMVLEGQIRDALTVATVLRAKILLSEILK